jgi:hypothetical protein
MGVVMVLENCVYAPDTDSVEEQGEDHSERYDNEIS